MANNADGTDGKGTMKMGRSQVSGKDGSGYGGTASRGMAPTGKTVSGKEMGGHGTKMAKNVGTTKFPTGVEDMDSAVSKHGGKF